MSKIDRVEKMPELSDHKFIFRRKSAQLRCSGGRSKFQVGNTFKREGNFILETHLDWHTEWTWTRRDAKENATRMVSDGRFKRVRVMTNILFLLSATLWYKNSWCLITLPNEKFFSPRNNIIQKPNEIFSSLNCNSVWLKTWSSSCIRYNVDWLIFSIVWLFGLL